MFVVAFMQIYATVAIIIGGNAMHAQSHLIGYDPPWLEY